MGVFMEKTKATIVVETGVWKEFKKLAIEKDMRISQLLEVLVSDYMNR
jgi:hypothetical protein